MAASQYQTLVIKTLRGGLSNYDQPIELPDDACPLVENIDFERSSLGGKRRGQVAVTVSGATINTSVVFLHRHLPTVDETASQLWATSVSGTTSIWNYKDTSWHAVTPTDALDTTVNGSVNTIRGLTLHGKLFLAYPLVSGVDRLMVWDGSTLRRTGLAEPAAPVVTNSGSGSFATTRYYRYRYLVNTPTLAIRLSEPSDTTTFTISGTPAGASLAKPAAINEGETHWMIEESINNADFYQIATVAVGTATYVDTNTPEQVTGGVYVLSPPIGTYSLQYSPKFLMADADRLVMGGSWQQAPLASRISWTPVYGAIGFGNDERLNENDDPFVDLDGYDGGALTDCGGPVAGYMYAFKLKRIFKLIRTGNVKQAYQAIKVTSAVGALPHSCVPGVDENGRECLYFLDPEQGPKRIGANGLESCGEDLGGTWKTLTKNALLPSHGIYYPSRRQVWWWVALSDAIAPVPQSPTQIIVANTRSFSETPQGIRRGWSLYLPASGAESLAAYASCMYADNINANTTRNLTLRPLQSGPSNVFGTSLIRICDSGTTDISTSGTAQPYRARIRTKPFAIGSMLQRPSIRAGSLMATASSGTTVYTTLIRDYGVETGTPIAVSLTPAGTETTVIRPMDNLALSDLLAVQVELGDVAAVDNDWELTLASFVVSPGESA